MKRLLVLLIASALMLSGAVLYSQETVNEDAAAGKTAVKPAEKKKNPTKAFEMGEIVVKDRAIANVEDASTTTEITDKDIKARGEKTLADSMQMVPGVVVSASGKGNTRFNLRGFDQDRVVLLVDGIPINDVYESSVDISQIPVMNVSKIVVNRGVASALYGANGALGSINVITKRPEEMTTEVNAEYGQWNNYSLNVANGSPIGNAYYWITGSVMHSGGYEVSKKLDASERTKWFNKFVRSDLYGSPAILLKSKDEYINDTGIWDHTEYTKYNVGGKFGYNITDKIEAGISANYNKSEQKSNTYSANLFSKYTDASPMGSWGDPSGSAYTTDGKSSAFQNRAYYWPEKYDFTVSPYFKGEFGDLTVKGNLFYYKQFNDLEAYATQDHTLYMFPPTESISGTNPAHSLWTDQSFGVNLYPSYKIADWNKVNFALTYRSDSHTEEEQLFTADESPIAVTATYHGNDPYKTRFVAADFMTFAVEDEMKFFKEVEVTVGISYDVQNFTDSKSLSKGTAVIPGVYADTYMVEDDSMIWGTRDSFNPTIAVVWNTIEDYLKLRAAASSKTKFAPLSAYAKITSATDTKVEPERSYNGNLGFEVTPLGEMLNLRIDYFYSRFNNKLESVYDPAWGTTVYTNIDGVISQGIESSISGKFENVAGIVDVAPSVSYTYIHARQKSDVANDKINKGKLLENTPEHMFTADIRFDFITDTSLNIYGTHTRNQIMYAMKSRPTPMVDTTYSTEYFEAVELHNPIMFNVKISQKIFENYDVYVTCKNILDDYNADPFNPGAGRMFAFGGSAKF